MSSWLDKKLANSTFSQAHSFYRLGKNRDGKVFTNWPAPVTTYVLQNRKPKWDDLLGAEKLFIKDGLRSSKRLRLFIVGMMGLLAIFVFRVRR